MVFFRCPEDNLPPFLLAHISRFSRRICGQTVVFHGVIEYAAKLIVDCFQICRGIPFSLAVGEQSYLDLPIYDVFRCDFRQLPFGKVLVRHS